MKKKMILVALTMLSCFQFAKAQSTASKLVINEIMARNIDMMMDPSFNYGGWIELYNPTNTAINLNGLYISHDKTNPKMVAIPAGNGSVPAKGFKTLWFDHYSTGGEYSDKAKNQIDFKIDTDGDELFISDKNGTILVSQVVPPAIARTSYARKTDGGSEWGFTYTPTQGKSNEGSIFAEVQLATPVVDRTGTVYTSDFDIHVTIPEGATLRYTTDGTTPDLINGATSQDGVFGINGKKNYVYHSTRMDSFPAMWLHILIYITPATTTFPSCLSSPIPTTSTTTRLVCLWTEQTVQAAMVAISLFMVQMGQAIRTVDGNVPSTSS